MEFVEFFVDLGPYVFAALPVEADVGDFILDAIGFDECRQ